MLAWAAALAAVAVAPMADALRQDVRSEPMTFRAASEFSLSWPSLLMLLVPDFYGHGSEGDYWGDWFYWECTPFVGVVGLWGIAFFAVDLTQTILAFNTEADARGLTGQKKADYIAGQRIIWAGITSLAINVGAFVGMSGFSWLASRIGRKPAFAITLVAAAASVATVFMGMKTRTDVIWMNILMGLCMLALFGGYAIYFPELFPTRLRSTGTSFCYNVGRMVAASGPQMLAFLTSPAVFGVYERPLPFRYAGVAMCAVFVIGLLVLPFLPETKDKPLPE